MPFLDTSTRPVVLPSPPVSRALLAEKIKRTLDKTLHTYKYTFVIIPEQFSARSKNLSLVSVMNNHNIPKVGLDVLQNLQARFQHTSGAAGVKVASVIVS